MEARDGKKRSSLVSSTDNASSTEAMAKSQLGTSLPICEAGYDNGANEKLGRFNMGQPFIASITRLLREFEFVTRVVSARQ